MKTTTKLIGAVLIVLLSASTLGQVLSTSPYSTLNNNLRQMFGNLAPPANSDKLYDMTVHLSDDQFYSGFNLTSNDLENWMVMYEELYYSSITLVPSNELPNKLALLNAVSNQEVPIMALDYNYHTFLDSNVFKDTSYFYFDTLNNTLSDNPNRTASPYKIKNVFSGMLYRQAVRFTDVTFRLDPQFLFHDAYNNIDFTTYEFQIDFGDGSGFQVMNTTFSNSFTVNYPTSGDYLVKYRIFDAENGIIINESASTLRVEKSYASTSVSPDSTFTVGGLKVGVYEPCEDVPLHRRKAFIILTGFDPLDESTNESWYDEFINDQKIENLLGYGHQIYLVRYANSTIDLRINAGFVVSLINKLKCEVFAEGAEQFTVLGYSMGGLIGRYALLHMENNPPPPGTCNPQRRHNTKLFISMDAPQQGANVPMSFQRIWYDVNAVINLLPPLPLLRYKLFGLKNAILDQPAARQMLSRHAETGIFTGIYTPHLMHTALMNEMASMGNYPSHCKNMALSFGMLDGTKQQSEHTGTDLPTQYQFINASVNVSVKILWWKVKLIEGYAEINSNPNLIGTLFDAGLDVFGFSIQVKLFGLKLKIGLKSVFNIMYPGINLQPYCSHSGSYYDIPINLKAKDGNDWWNIGINKSDNGQIGLATSGGWQYTSDATHFCFIPTQSALDYGAGMGGLSLTHDITSDTDPATNTPFDVIIGCHSGAVNWEENKDHTSDFRNTIISGSIDNGFLVREAGDDILWLDNYNLHWDAEYSALKEITAGFQTNPHYQYAGSGIPTQWIMGAYADNNTMSMTPSSGNATFIVDVAGGIFNNNGVSGSFVVSMEKLSLCVDLIKSKSNISTGNDIVQAEIFPNPGTEWVNISIKGLENDQNASISLYNIQGQELSSVQLNYDNASSAQIRTDHLASGLYLIKVQVGDKSYLHRWLKQ